MNWVIASFLAIPILNSVTVEYFSYLIYVNINHAKGFFTKYSKLLIILWEERINNFQ